MKQMLTIFWSLSIISLKCLQNINENKRKFITSAVIDQPPQLHFKLDIIRLCEISGDVISKITSRIYNKMDTQ